jgi:hypothetical protein
MADPANPIKQFERVYACLKIHLKSDVDKPWQVFEAMEDTVQAFTSPIGGVAGKIRSSIGRL